jgi:ABC-2 type transport system permease protein
MRSVFLPDSFATQEVAASWESGRTAIILIVWLVVGLIFAIKTFRWERK